VGVGIGQSSCGIRYWEVFFLSQSIYKQLRPSVSALMVKPLLVAVRTERSRFGSISLTIYETLPADFNLECGEPLVPIPLEMFAVVSPHPYQHPEAPYGERSPYHLRQSVLNSLIQPPS